MDLRDLLNPSEASFSHSRLSGSPPDGAGSSPGAFSSVTSNCGPRGQPAPSWVESSSVSEAPTPQSDGEQWQDDAMLQQSLCTISTFDDGASARGADDWTPEPSVTDSSVISDGAATPANSYEDSDCYNEFHQQETLDRQGGRVGSFNQDVGRGGGEVWRDNRNPPRGFGPAVAQPQHRHRVGQPGQSSGGGDEPGITWISESFLRPRIVHIVPRRPTINLFENPAAVPQSTIPWRFCEIRRGWFIDLDGQRHILCFPEFDPSEFSL